jgi:hypothetical protein
MQLRRLATFWEVMVLRENLLEDSQYLHLDLAALGLSDEEKNAK